MGSERKRPGELYWQVVETIWDSVSIYDGSEAFLEQYSQVPPYAGHLLAAHWCQSEVRNGGFHQFFWNPTGVLAPEAAAGFKAIGLHLCAEVVEEAMAWFEVPYARDQEFRRITLALFGVLSGEDEWDPFDSLNRRFFDLLNSEGGGFERAADAYARQASMGELV